jgi:hypothetical protein
MMTLLGLELSDAGILVSTGRPPRLIEIDQGSLESAGFALPDKARLITGREAEAGARLHPRQLMNRFWDQLSTDPVEAPTPAARNQAEAACAHLERIWERARHFGQEMVIAVPGYYRRDQLGLILGMAQELGAAVRGFVSLPVAAADPHPAGLRLHLDIHLHRFEVSVLRTGEEVVLVETATAAEKGLEILRRVWAEAAAAEFVRTTRFDPFHRAESEQALYDRLAVALEALQQTPEAVMEIAAGRSMYRISLTRERLLRKAAPVYDEHLALLNTVLERHAEAGAVPTFQITHRLARLPGFVERLQQAASGKVRVLPPGAAALALQGLWRTLDTGQNGAGAVFFTRRPRPAPAAGRPVTPPAADRRGPEPAPTHLLHGSLAYPIGRRPLEIGSEVPAGAGGIRIGEADGGVRPRHCTVERRGDRVLLTDHSAGATRVDGRQVEGVVQLKVGHTLRVGDPGATLSVISCLDSHEA